MAQGEFPSFYRYVGPSPSGGYYYDDPTTGQILDLPAAPTPDQRQAYEAENPKTGTIGQTQATTELAEPTQTLGGTPANARDDAPAQVPTSGGVGAGTSNNAYDSVRPDDNPGSPVSTKNATVTAIDNLYGDGAIVPQGNILDQYASYTYQASVYLMKPETFNAMVKSRTKSLNGAQLLFQSGGAPLSGRNPYFSNDYYIDKIELKSTITGKGTNASHNVNTIKMTVVEPAGITLLSNLDKAVQQYLGTGNKKQNFASQLYLLVIRFFGYDSNGNLVQAGQSTGMTNIVGATGTAFVEKYYPMAINKINFKVANKLVEYEIEATAPQYQIAVGQSRGTIPYNVELSGMSVKDALAGVAVVTTATNSREPGNAQQPDLVGESYAVPGTVPPAPPKASAAPSPKSTIRKGLMEALNQYQKDLVDRKIYTVADEYSIEFTEPSIEQAKITVPGTDFKNTSPQAPKTAADKVDPSRQQVDPNSRILTITAGQQIVQVIDQAVRNSSYIRSQQTTTIEEGSQKQKANGTPGKNVAWFKISLQATPIKFDPKRNDYAYKIKYIVSPYRINQTNSNYFATPKFKGVHKQYNYWFTGQNTQVLNYEQTYNALYTYVLSGGDTDPAKTNNQAKYNYQPRSGQTSQGADLRTNEPAANLADSLYNPADLGTASLTIVGDPAWLQQGEASFQPPGKQNFVSTPFLADGTINFESQQILFEIIINTPTDYDLNTGIMDVNNKNPGSATNQSKPANQSYVYIANECTSEFSKGKFTQNIKGTLLPPQPAQSSGNEGRNGLGGGAATSLISNSNTRGTGIPQSQADAQDQENGANAGEGTGSTETEDITAGDLPPTPQPALPPEPPTSSGDIDFTAGLAGTPPPATADQFRTNGVVPTSEELEARNLWTSSGSPTSGPLYDNYVTARQTFNDRAAGAAPTVTTQAPQIIARDDA